MHQWTTLFEPGSVHREALRLRGLALALHMVQDMTVPHHIAPTTAYGHSNYETWFSGWLFPSAKDGKTLRSFDSASVDAKAGAYSIGQPSAAANRWQADTLDGTGAAKTTNAMWAEIDALNEGDADGFQNFWEWVDDSWDQLDGDMTALVGGDCEDTFSVRALARAVAFHTARAVAEEGLLAPITGLNSAERSQSGFWIMSALSVAESFDSSVKSDIDPIEVPTWRPVAGRTVPFLIAATARLLMEAARAHEDASTTCDSGEDEGPPLDGARRAEISALSCEERPPPARSWAASSSRTAPVAPSTPGCPATTSAPAPAGPTPATDAATRRWPWPRAPARQRAARRSPRRSGGGSPTASAGSAGPTGCATSSAPARSITPTALFQTGHGAAADRDRDGIPDAVDDCPAQGASIGVWPGTTLDVGVCWRRAAGAGTCRYGCPLPRGDEDRN